MSKIDEKVDELQKELSAIELDVLTNYTLADAIREGASITAPAAGWGDGHTACALTAAVISARARRYI